MRREGHRKRRAHTRRAARRVISHVYIVTIDGAEYDRDTQKRSAIRTLRRELQARGDILSGGETAGSVAKGDVRTLSGALLYQAHVEIKATGAIVIVDEL